MSSSMMSSERSWKTLVGETPIFKKTGRPTILMCPPTYFTVEYAINPWMENVAPCDTELAKRQWEDLYNAIMREAGADVVLLDPVEGLPDLVFTANAALVYNDVAVTAHYRHTERQGEEPYGVQWFKEQGFKVTQMPQGTYFEGSGDGLIWEDRIFSGYRARTSIEAHNVLTQATGLPVLSVELADPRYYHVDVCMCPLADGHLIYAPSAFDAYGNAVIEANVPVEKRIPVTPEEAANFACNAVNVNDVVIFHEGSHRMADDLKARGFKTVQVNMSEFLKSGGSAKCMTLRVG